MKNRNVKPTVRFPKKCPKCGGFIVSGVTWIYGKPEDVWECKNCGLNGESDGWFDARFGVTRKMGERA